MSISDKLTFVLLAVFVLAILPPTSGFFFLLLKRAGILVLVAGVALVGLLLLKSLSGRGQSAR